MFRLAALLSRLARPWSHRTSKSAIRNPHSDVRSRRLFLESLEPRKVLSTFTVINTDDSGAGSLRQAIIDANDNAGHDTIAFNIPGPGVHTIEPLTNLPSTADVTIDAATQAGYAPDGLHPIELNGENLPWELGDAALQILGDATVRGLTINRFFTGIVVIGPNNRIEGNYVGTDPEAVSVFEMGRYELVNYPFSAPVSMNNGIVLQSSQTIIGGTTPQQRNVISGNRLGITIGNADHTQIVGNYIGTNRTGEASLGNGVGIKDSGDSQYHDENFIGGFTPGQRNIISGNGDGVYGGANRVVGNYIGTDPTGMHAVPNAQFGVASTLLVGGTETGAGNLISGNLYGASGCLVVQGNRIGTDATGDGALGNWAGVAGGELIGGSSPGAGNVISGNTVGIFGGAARIQGNYIGTNAGGTFAVGNGDGIYLFSGSGPGVVIGGSQAGEGNVISGNNRGIYINGAQADNHFEGNLIGLAADGQTPISNGHGIAILNGTMNQVIGGTTPGAGNKIAFNGTGIVVSRSAPGYPYASNNQFIGNSIFGNQGLGIDLSDGFGGDADGVTPNDALDADIGSNEFQNFPELTAASSAVTTRVQGSLHSTPSSTFTVDFYANSTVDPSGYGEGERWLGSATVTTDADGNGAFDVVVPGASSAGEFISSTATDAVGNTSEFSQAVQSVLGVKTVTIDIQPESCNVESNGTLTVVIFGAADFDAAQIDVSSVQFAGAGVWHSTLVDANNDGRLDLQVKFRVQDTALEELYAQLLVDDYDADGILDSTRQTAQVEVTGQTLDDEQFSGADNINLFLAGRSLRNLLDELFG